MNDLRLHDQIIAKIQHFAELIKQHQNEKTMLLFTSNSEDDCEKEKLKNQILLCEELLKEYYKIFDDILYR
jgi:hypothetical protein